MPYIDDAPVADPDTIKNLSEHQILELVILAGSVELSPAAVCLLRFAAAGDIAVEDYTGTWPADRHELGICEHIFDVAPRWLRNAMTGLLDAFARHNPAATALTTAA